MVAFKALAARDEAQRKKLLNNLETVLSLAIPQAATRYIEQAKDVSSYPIAYVVPGPDHTPETWEKGKAEIVGLIESALDYIALTSPVSPRLASDASLNAVPQSEAPTVDRVFLVHGRDRTILSEVESFLRRIEVNPVILSEEPNQGRTIIEKFEHHSDVNYAIVLLAGEDIGRLAILEGSALKPRARQNVVFELGFFVGKLGRSRVSAIVPSIGDEGLELPSDVLGLGYIELNRSHPGTWRLPLVRELRGAAIAFNADKL